MNLITEHEALFDAFESLISAYDKVQFCVAWAGAPKSFRAAKLLTKNRKKIERAVVGLHFYQTDPQFIREFLDCDAIRYRKRTDGVFHDKIYFFYNSPKDWCAIIGSSNFTHGGFEKNDECNILISNDDVNGGVTFKGIVKHIEDMWANSEYFTIDQLLEYIDCFSLQKGKQDSLSRIVKSDKHMFLSSQLIHMTWEEYSALLDKNPTKLKRLRVLSYAHTLFNKYRSYADMTEIERKRLCGEDASDSIFDFFGTNGKGVLVNQMVEAHSNITRAIDSIPLTGEITREHFETYVKLFCGKDWANPVAGATRLLAMKRPDVFLCFNGANKELLGESLGFKPNSLKLKNYWDLIVERIRQCSWYNEHDSSIGKEYWPYRVALLDAFYYTPKTEE